MEVLSMEKTGKKNYKYLMIFIAMIPTLSDWNYKVINFGDVMIVIALFILLLLYKEKVFNFSKSYLLKTIMILSLLNVLFHYFFNDGYYLNKGLVYLSKLSVFLLFISCAFAFITDVGLNDEFVRINTKIASIICLIGIIISILLVCGSDIPQNYIWHFTRSDIKSYTYVGKNIIRMRSLFSEPSYLGIYLNLVISVSLFRKNSRKPNLFSISFLCCGVILTFSFSAILTLLIIFLLFLFKNRKKILENKKMIFLAILICSLLVVVFSDQIYQTIFLRMKIFLSGSDTSTNNRLIGSWQYINPKNILFGNGFGSTPAIWNNIAYVISDLGLIGFIPLLGIFYKLICKNKYLAFMLITFSFQRGGYMNSYYWFSLLMIFIYSFEKTPFIKGN